MFVQNPVRTRSQGSLPWADQRKRNIPRFLNKHWMVPAWHYEEKHLDVWILRTVEHFKVLNISSAQMKSCSISSPLIILVYRCFSFSCLNIPCTSTWFYSVYYELLSLIKLILIFYLKRFAAESPDESIAFKIETDVFSLIMNVIKRRITVQNLLILERHLFLKNEVTLIWKSNILYTSGIS